MDTKTGLRQLKIKSGALKRCQKDYTSYREEQTNLEEKLEKLKAEENADEGKIKQAEEAVAETVQMLPGCVAKVQAGVPELEAIIEECKENEEVTSTEDWQNAVTILDQAKQFLETI